MWRFVAKVSLTFGCVIGLLYFSPYIVNNNHDFPTKDSIVHVINSDQFKKLSTQEQINQETTLIHIDNDIMALRK